MADKEKLLRPESDVDSRRSDSNGWVWSGDDVDESEDRRTQRRSADVWARHDAVNGHDPASAHPALTVAPDVALFGNVEIDSISDPVNLAIFNDARTPVELEPPTVRPGTSNDGHVPVDEFLVAEPSKTAVAVGQPAMLAVAFAPKHAAGSRSTLHVRGRAGAQAVHLQVSLRGQGIKQRRDEDANKPIHAEQREQRRATWQSLSVAEQHKTPGTQTYGEMLTTVLAAQRLTQSGSRDDHAHARELLLAVSRHLHELAPSARERLRDYGWGHNPGLAVFDRATASIDDWVQKLGFGGSFETGHLLTAFELGAEEIRLVTGERSDAPTLRAVHEAAKITPAAVAGGALAGAAVGVPVGALLGSAPALAGAIGEEAGLLSLAARIGRQRLLLWGAAHPVLAVELVSAFVGVGTAINSWDDFVQALQDPREAMFLLMQVASELMHVHQARSPGPGAHLADGAQRSPITPVAESQIAEELRARTANVRSIAADPNQDTGNKPAKEIGAPRRFDDRVPDAVPVGGMKTASRGSGSDLAKREGGLDVSSSHDTTSYHPKDPRVASAASAAGIDLVTLTSAQRVLVETGEEALANGDIHGAASAFDKLVQSGVSRESVGKLETSLAEAHGRTAPAVYRDPKAILPSGAAVPPTSHRGDLYYGTHEIEPAVAFDRGLPGRGTNTRLLDHVEQSPDSAFRGTTRYIISPDGTAGAGAWAGEGGWVYKIDSTASWDVNAELEGRVPSPDGRYGGNPMKGEHEQAVLASIPRERIVGAMQMIQRNGVLRPGPLLPNPHYKPVK